MSGLLDILSLGSDFLNFGFQQQNQNYLRQMQIASWGREDDAVQRRVRDLEKAGLSPVLAAGSAASSSSPINPGIPQFKPSNMMSSAEYTSMKKQNAVTDANLDYVHAQTDATDANSWVNRMFRDEMIRDASREGKKSFDLINSMADKMIADNKRSVRESKEYIRNTTMLENMGLPSNSQWATDTAAEGALLYKRNAEIGAKVKMGIDTVMQMLGIASKVPRN